MCGGRDEAVPRTVRANGSGAVRRCVARAGGLNTPDEGGIMSSGPHHRQTYRHPRARARSPPKGSRADADGKPD